MWQLEDDSWVEVSCSAIGSRASIDRLAAAVELAPLPIRVPVDLELPNGYGPSEVELDLRTPGSRIYLGAIGRHPGPPGADLLIMVDAPEFAPAATGSPTTLGGHPASVDDDHQHPVVWVQEQGRWIFVGAETGDTGPYPDRSADLPVLMSLAASMTYAKDLSDPRTWFSAENVFG